MSCQTKVIVPVAINASHILSSDVAENDPYNAWSTSAHNYGDVVKYGDALYRSNQDANSGNKPLVKLGNNPNFAAVPVANLFKYSGAGAYENYPAFDVALGYSAGDRFYDPRQNNLVIEALQTVAAGVYPPIFSSADLEGDTAWDLWKLSNPLRLFDLRAGDTTQASGETITIELRPDEAWTHLALFGLSASSVSVVVTDVADNELYNETISASNGAADWWEYFFDYDDVSSDLVVDVGGAGYINKKLTLTITKTGSVAELGILFVGNEVSIGSTLMGLTSGGRSFAEVTSNAFGVTGVSAGAAVRDLDVPTRISNDDFDTTNAALRGVLGKVVLLVGSERLSTTIAYGLAKEFSLSVRYDKYSACTFTLESLI